MTYFKTEKYIQAHGILGGLAYHFSPTFVVCLFLGGAGDRSGLLQVLAQTKVTDVSSETSIF